MKWHYVLETAAWSLLLGLGMAVGTWIGSGMGAESFRVFIASSISIAYGRFFWTKWYR